MTDSVVVEGYVKFRDGKKWKTRWVVIRKPSPVADCLVLLVFKDKSDKAQGHRERGSFTLEDICGLETGQWYEGVSHTLAIICLAQATLLGFDSKEALHAWDIRIRYSLGEVHRFIVGVLPGTKLESGPASLHLCNNLLALSRDTPPVITGHWNLPDLRRYGPVLNGFVFEGGTRCGYWAGVFFLASTDGEQISFLFDCIVRGISPSRGPYGLQPVLPDPCANKAYSEERANHEAQELEKRLSMLSHRSSAALSVYNPCLAGDDRSISGSSDTSDTSHSDCSIGSRLAIWPEPATGPSSPSDNVGQTGPKVASQSSTEKLSISQGGGCRTASKAPRQLQEIGRQSSADSGIATGSHSSYTGSFSSYTGSLDIAPGEDFGSILTLPPHLAADLSPCTCPPVPGHEYQVPTSLRYLYDTPRNVFQEGSGGIAKETEPHTGQPVDSSEPSEGSDCCSAVTGGSPDTAETQPTTGPPQEPSEENRKSKVAPSCDSHHPDSCRICSSLTPASKTIFTICSACGGFKGTPYTPASCAVIPAIPDQSVDKSPCSSGTSAQQPTKMFTTKKTAASSRSQGATHSSQKHEQKEDQETSQPKKGREKLASLIAELLSYPKAGVAVTKANQMTSYESMRSVLGREPESKLADGCAAALLLSDSQRDNRTALYEKCFKCRGQKCHRPLHVRVTPANAYTKHTSSTLHSCAQLCTADQRWCTIFGQPVPSGAWIRKTREHEVDPLEQVHGSGGAWSMAGAPQFKEEVNGHSVTFEDKKLNVKEERHKVDPAYEIMESRALEKNSETEDKIKYELMATYGQQRHFHESEGPVFVFPPEMPFPDRPRGGGGGDGVTYVNIPVSPTSKKELNYMELELQESSLGIRGAAGAHLPPQRKSSSKYAQIDITATETAHKVGTQHALCREEGLHTLDLRRRGMPQ